MTNKVIVYKRPDGGVSIVHPAPNARLDGETDDEFLQRIIGKDVPPNAADVSIIDKALLPENRSKRNSWKLSGKRVVVDLAL